MIAHLDAIDADAYSRAVARVTPVVERSLGPGVVANRARLTGPSLVLEEWRPARARFRAAIARASTRPGAVLIADVRRCYASIEPAVVEERLAAIGTSRGDVERIGELLRRFQRRGLHGLPVGPDASAVIANAVLARVDRELAGLGAPYLRWVDDVAVFAPDRATASRARDRFHAALRQMGMEGHETKTRVIADRGHACDLLLRGPGSPASRLGHEMMRRP